MIYHEYPYMEIQICIHIWISIYGYAHMDIHISISIYAYLYMYSHIWLSIYDIHIWISIYGYPCTDIHIWVPRDPWGGSMDPLGGAMGRWHRWDLGTDGTWASRTPDTSSELFYRYPAWPARPGPARPSPAGPAGPDQNS